MEFDAGAVGGGFGSTHFGTFFGAGAFGSWGLFTGTRRTVQQSVVCENCSRVRLNKTLGGVAIFGTYVDGDHFVVVASDVGLVTCFELRFEGAGRTFTAPVVRRVGTPLPVAATPPATTAPLPPAGAELANTILQARLPEVPETGEYTVTFVDRCAGVEVPLVTLTLEEPPMIITPDQAELGGFPDLWLRQSYNTPTQPASGSAKGIPLDYCEAVIEYDARLGSLPSAQGWTHQAGGGSGVPGNYALVEGGALRAGTPGSSNPSYWEADESLSAAPAEVHAYAAYLLEADTPTPAVGESLDLQALFASSGGAYQGGRLNFKDGLLYATQLNLGGETAWSLSEYDEHGWHFTALDSIGTDAVVIHNDVLDRVGSLFGSVAGPAPADEIRARFGDVVGQGITAYIRNFVVSTPGRFIRPMFRGVAPVDDPVLRLYVTRDNTAAAGLGVRLLVKYASGTTSPYALPSTALGSTINMPTANSMMEVAFTLTGLTAGQPIVFTVERDWSSGADTLESTVWLNQATIRSS
jgi:hypothetical protein